MVDTMHGRREKMCIERIRKFAEDKNDAKLLSFLKKAAPNKKSSLFPDFLLDDGLIECFQVSAAHEGRKGSDHNIAVNSFERESEAAFEQERNDFLQAPPRKNPAIGAYDLHAIKHELACPNYSYEGFVKSFKGNFEKHMDHLRKYAGDKTNSIFLIEVVGAMITIEQNRYFKDVYRLSNDYNLLQYISEHSEQLWHIVFINGDYYEFIEIKEIPEIQKRAPRNMTFGVGRYLRTDVNVFVDL